MDNEDAERMPNQVNCSCKRLVGVKRNNVSNHTKTHNKANPDEYVGVDTEVMAMWDIRQKGKGRLDKGKKR